MYIVTVEYVIDSGHILTFLDAVLENAETSLHQEPGCHQFDVNQSHENPTQFFLYEQFNSDVDFQQHLESEHYLTFSRNVSHWVISKEVRTWYSC
ncbi:putative quinol monooxygenase [Catenovulum sediminis]|uniref:Quinol monooxygenase n=1 Tax=Catenovulum sediminis TaxID=1740262 RepID=A0ABV1RME4_9ALTE|nr:putative quinol monooxygenase [Catenovulum sediminis]